jgi:hypothetical protein
MFLHPFVQKKPKTTRKLYQIYPCSQQQRASFQMRAKIDFYVPREFFIKHIPAKLLSSPTLVLDGCEGAEMKVGDPRVYDWQVNLQLT